MSGTKQQTGEFNFSQSENAERVVCNGCQNCKVTCNKGSYTAICKVNGPLVRVITGQRPLFILGAKKCKKRQ